MLLCMCSTPGLIQALLRLLMFNNLAVHCSIASANFDPPGTPVSTSAECREFAVAIRPAKTRCHFPTALSRLLESCTSFRDTLLTNSLLR